MWTPDEEDELINSELSISEHSNSLNGCGGTSSMMLFNNKQIPITSSLIKENLNKSELNGISTNPFSNVVSGSKRQLDDDTDSQTTDSYKTCFSDSFVENLKSLERKGKPINFNDYLSDEELIAEIRTAGIHYVNNTDLTEVNRPGRWDIDDTKIIYQGNVPVLVSDEFFVPEPIIKQNVEIKQNGGSHIEPSTNGNEMHKMASNIGNSSKEEEWSNLSIFKPSYAKSEPQLAKTRTPIASRISRMVGSNHSELVVKETGTKPKQKHKKKKFQPVADFFACTMVQQATDQPTIGIANTKYYTPRQLYLMNRFRD